MRLLKTIITSVALSLALPAFAATTIDTSNRYAYGSNIGWLDAHADTTNGLKIGEYVCSGYIYSGNVGWINMGNGSPANGIQYQNNSATDFGINHDGVGNLRGNAYGANIGWVTFETNGAPKVDLRTGKLSGSVYSANCGWISLSNAFAYVQTTTIDPGADNDGDGIPDAWELSRIGITTQSALADPDGDGISNYDEYLADSNPLDPNDNLRITSISTDGMTSSKLTWSSSQTRFYLLEKETALGNTNWIDSGLSLITPDGSTTTRTVTDTNATARFYRVQAKLPLAP